MGLGGCLDVEPEKRAVGINWNISSLWKITSAYVVV